MAYAAAALEAHSLICNTGCRTLGLVGPGETEEQQEPLIDNQQANRFYQIYRNSISRRYSRARSESCSHGETKMCDAVLVERPYFLRSFERPSVTSCGPPQS